MTYTKYKVFKCLKFKVLLHNNANYEKLHMMNSEKSIRWTDKQNIYNGLISELIFTSIIIGVFIDTNNNNNNNNSICIALF